jgi:hypothetical protein
MRAEAKKVDEEVRGTGVSPVFNATDTGETPVLREFP